VFIKSITTIITVYKLLLQVICVCLLICFLWHF